MVTAITYFTQHQDLYTSLEGTAPQNPRLTTAFPNTSYTEPAFYYFDSSSTFTALPYIDELLPEFLDSSLYTSSVQRINVYVQNSSNPSDLTARTFPATDLFSIPSLATITDRFKGVADGEFTISTPYVDVLSVGAGEKETLVGLRAKVKTGGLVVMMEVELLQIMFGQLLHEIYYFPSSTLLLVTKTNTGDIAYYSNTPQQLISDNISLYYELGPHRVLRNVENTAKEQYKVAYISATLGLASSYVLGGFSTVSNTSSDVLRCIVVVDAKYT